MPVIHLDCSSLIDNEFDDVSLFLSKQTGVTKILLQPFLLDTDDLDNEEDEGAMILNIEVSKLQWKAITSGSAETPANEQAAKWLIGLLHIWSENQRDMAVGYDGTENIVVLADLDEFE